MGDMHTAGTALTNIQVGRECHPETIVLDLTRPDLDGQQVMRLIRHDRITSAVLILSARDDESEKVVGVRLSVDDDMTKPFGLLELLARVEVILRRGRAVVRVGDLEIDRDARIVKRRRESVSLSPKEFDLFDALVQRRGAVAGRTELLREVWGYSGFVTSRTVDTHVAQLRRKLEDDPAAPAYILTGPKSGYRLGM